MEKNKLKSRSARLEEFNIERKKFVQKIENSKLPFALFLEIFFASIILRFILEVSLAHYSNTFLDLPGFLLILFYYISIALSTIILFYLFTKKSILSISRLVLATFPLITLPPIIDFVISGGKGFTEGYLLPGTNIVFAFFTLGGSPANKLITLGLRIEVILFLFLCFYYFQTIKPNLIKNFIKTTIVYSVIFLYFSTLIILKPVLGFFSINIFDYWYQSFYSTYMILIVIQLTVLFYFYNNKLFKLVLFDCRPLRAFHFVLMFAIGIFIGAKTNQIQVGIDFLITLTFTSLAIIFAWFFSVAQNNIVDFKIDLVSNKTRPLQVGVDPKQYSILPPFFLFLSLSFAICAGITSFIAIILFAMSYFFYSNPPFRFKQIPLLSKLLISFCSLLLIITGFISAGGTLSLFPVSIVILFLVGYTLAINFIDIKDYLGDKKEKIQTLPVILGLKKSKLLIGLFFVIAYTLSYFVVEKIELVPFLVAFSIIEFFLINKKNYVELPVFIVYLISLLIIAYFYVIP